MSYKYNQDWKLEAMKMSKLLLEFEERRKKVVHDLENLDSKRIQIVKEIEDLSINAEKTKEEYQSKISELKKKAYESQKLEEKARIRGNFTFCAYCENVITKKITSDMTFINKALGLTLYFCSRTHKEKWIFRRQNKRDQIEEEGLIEL